MFFLLALVRVGHPFVVVCAATLEQLHNNYNSMCNRLEGDHEGAVVTALLTLPLKDFSSNLLSWNGQIKVSPIASMVRVLVDN